MRQHILVLAAAALLACGCSPAERKDVEQSARAGARKVEQSAKEGVKAVGEGLSVAKLKSELMASSKLDASHINVDLEGNTFHLRGSVPNAEQKTLANQLSNGMIARDQKVVDELKIVAPTTSAKP